MMTVYKRWTLKSTIVIILWALQQKRDINASFHILTSSSNHPRFYCHFFEKFNECIQCAYDRWIWNIDISHFSYGHNLNYSRFSSSSMRNDAHDAHRSISHNSFKFSGKRMKCSFLFILNFYKTCAPLVIRFVQQ